MTVGGAIGMIAAALQNIEKLSLLEHGKQALTCDINSVFSCSTVLSAWQSSVFGFPNSIMCLTFFTIFATVGLVGLSGGTLSRALRLGIQGLALFVLAFALWFLQQSIYSIQALCMLCLFCFSGLLLINWAWLRVNVNDLPFSTKAQAFVKRMVKSNVDTVVWLSLAVVVAVAMLLKFYV